MSNSNSNKCPGGLASCLPGKACSLYKKGQCRAPDGTSQAAALNHFTISNPTMTANWLVETLIPEGLVLIAGPPGSAKSMLAECLTWACAYERDFLGMKTKHGPTLYVNNDHPEDIHQRWLRRFCAGAAISHDPKHPLVSAHHRWSSFREKTSQEEIERAMDELKPAVVVFDRLSTVLGADEDRASNVEPFGELIRSWIKEFGFTAIIIHHFTKEPTHLDIGWLESTFLRRLRGSGAILGMADAALELFPTDHNQGKLREFGVRPHPKRTSTPPPFRVGLVEKDGIELEFRQGWRPVDSEIREVARLCLDLLSPDVQLSAKGIETRLGGSYDIKVIREALKYLRTTGIVSFSRGPKNIYVYSSSLT